VTLALTVAAAAGVASLQLAALSPAATNSSPSDSTGSANCPASNPPNTLMLVAGTPQTAQLDGPFAGGLQVAIANTR
jgi:hypothetical protein